MRLAVSRRRAYTNISDAIVLADCEDEMAVYNAIRNGVKSGELSVEPPRRRASRPGNPGNLVPALPVAFLRYRP